MTFCVKVSGSQVEGGSVGGHAEGSGVTMTVVVSVVTGQDVSTGGGVETTVVVVVDTATGQEVEGTGGQEASTVTVSVLKRVETGQVVSGGGGHEDGGGVTVVVTGQGEGEAVIVVGATDGHVGLSRGSAVEGDVSKRWTHAENCTHFTQHTLHTIGRV